MTKSGHTMVLIYYSAYSHFSGRPTPNHLPESCFTTSRNHIRNIFPTSKSPPNLHTISCKSRELNRGLFAKHEFGLIFEKLKRILGVGRGQCLYPFLCGGKSVPFLDKKWLS